MLKSLSGFDVVAPIAGLMLIAALLALPSNAAASDITYNIVDYPANQAVIGPNGPGDEAVTISGTIVTDGTIGPLSAANIVGGTLTVGPGWIVTGSASFLPPTGLLATPTELLLTPGTASSFGIYTSVSNQYENAGAWVKYENNPAGGDYWGGLEILPPTPPPGEPIWQYAVGGYFDSAPVPKTAGSIGASSDWVVAAVPEPTSLELVCAATAGIFVFRARPHFFRSG